MADTTKLREVWTGLETKGQITLVGSLAAVLAVFFFLYSYASKPSFSTLYTGLAPTDSSNITQALAGAGIPYRVSSGGTEVDVQSGQESAAQVALASKGLPNSGHVGFEIFDKQSLGATDFQQQVDYQRALEGELDRTLQQISGVTNADVQLVIPQDSLFATQSTQASASALITTSQQLDSSTVRGIAHLISGAVKGLKPEQVTLTDQTGALLWPDGSTGSGTGAAAATIQADQQYSTQLTSAIDGLLAQTLGPGKAQARVHADLNVDQTTLDKVTYGKGAASSTSSDTEQLQSKGGGAALPAGTSSNVPNATSATGTNSSSNYKHQVSNTQYGLDRTVQHTVVAPGTVNKLDIALLVDSSVPAAQASALKQSVAAMAGLDPKRGDTIELSRISFAKLPTATATAPKLGPLANPIGLAKYVAIALAALVFLFLMRRGLKRREGESLAGEPVWLREIEGPTPIAELEVAPVRTALDPAQERRATVRGQVEEIVRREPEQVAAQIGQWLKE